MKMMKRMLAAFLAVLMVAGAVPASAAAALADGSGLPSRLQTADGAVDVGDDWETTFPYGTFAFANSEAAITEGGDAALIRVFRLGGTKGRATVAVSFAPAVMPIGENVYGYALAAGGDDLVIEAEDPLPIAQYQPVGRDPDPEETKVRVRRAERGDDWVFSINAQADSYRWQVGSDKVWHFIEDAVEPTLPAAKADALGYDFRCVFTKNGVTYCTDSFNGVRYVKPEPEVLPELPDDLDLNPPQTFSRLETDPADPYLGYTFALTFADGESVKTLRVTATEDEIAECMEQCTFTLMACDGGSLYDTANTLILAVGDNDAPDPFSIGFVETEITADKADGYARLAVQRTGGNQTMVSVAFETNDGTAKKGTDYTAVSDELSLYGDAMLQYIDIPLINDGIADDAPRDLTVTLKGLKGDSAGIGTLTRTEATVHLINTAKSETRNLATALTDADAVDLSGRIDEAGGSAVTVSPKPVVGQQVETPAPLEAAILGYDGSDMQLQSYDYGAVHLSRYGYSDYDSQYWTESLDLLSLGLNWEGGERTDNGWRIKSDDDASATLWLANLPQLYTGFYGSYNFSAEWAQYMSAFSDAYTYPWASVIRSNGTNYEYTNCNPRVDGSKLTYDKTGVLRPDWGITEDVAGLRLGLTAGWTTSTEDAICEITSATLYRRAFSQEMNLRIHTANDGENGGLSIRTAPDGAAVLTTDSGVYAAIRPSVTLEQNSGGVTYGGKLFVGSKIRVSLGESAVTSFSPYFGDQLSSAVYLTRADGSVMNNALISRVSGTNDFIITMLWDGMTEADLTDTYTINVVLTRKQDLILDVSPSVERMKDENGQTLAAIDPAGIPDAWQLFLDSGKRYITVGTSKVKRAAPHFETGITETRIDVANAQITGAVLTEAGMENVQWINFNCDSEDRILYNGRMYNGDEKIWLNVPDLTQANMRFLYYQKSFLSATSVMRASIDSVAVYWDGDNNGRIDGAINKETGTFEIAPGSDDGLVLYLEPNTDYSETLFRYAANRAGTLCQMYLKIHYVMTPRALSPEPGQENLRAQVLPAFTTSVTDPSIYNSLTDELRSYRYILSGVGADGSYTSDGHSMFGAEATTPQFVDVPLGGDRNPAAPATVDGKEQYVWAPDYRGNLIYPYAMPEPIIIDHTIAGDNFALAPSAKMVDGALTMDEADRANLNGYLGSFVGNSTVALCVQQQAVTADQLAADPNHNTPQPEHAALIPNNTTPDESYLSVADNDNADTQGDFDSSESENAYPEFDLNMGMEIPKLNFGCTEHDFISYSSNGLERAISISIPVASYSKKPGKEGSWNGPLGTMGRAAKQWYNVALFFVCRDPLVLTATDSSYDDATALHGGSLNSASFIVVFIISGALKFKYNPVENEYKFVQYSVGALANLFFKAKHRFAPCPLVYVFLKVGFKVNIGTGGSFEFELKEEKPTVGVHGSELETLTLRKGKYYTIPIKYKTFNVRFNGKMALELYEDAACTRRVSGASNGFLNSDGGKKITVTMIRGDGYTFKDGKTCYLRLTAIKNTTVTYLAMVSSQRKVQYWTGVEITPEIYVNAGAGVGVELAKFELYAKLNVSAAMTIAPHNFDESFKFNSFKITIAIAYKLVLLFYSSTKDLISYTIKYDGETGKWSHSYSAIGGLYGDDLGTLSVTDSSGSTYDAILRLPEDPSGTQTVYSRKEKQSPFSLLSYHANDAAVPFELAGYSGSSDAAKLADGLTAGYDYKVVTLDGENYVFYTIGRSSARHANDNSMLVLSRLEMTGVQPGLVNPADPESATPYIPVDVLANGEADGAGDLAFHASAQDGALVAAWVSYANVTTANGETIFDTFDQAVHNTVVRTASFTPGSSRFTPAVTVSGAAGANVNTPTATGDAVIYTQARHASREELEAQTALYRAYLDKIGYGENAEDPARREIGAYRLATQKTMTDLNGVASTLCVAVDGAPRGNAQLPDGQTVANLEAACIDGVYYIVYTTEETCYTDAAGHTVDDPAAADAPDRLSIKRLYLRSFTLGADGAVQWQQGGKAILLRTLYDFDQNAGCSDGLYQGGACSARYNDPYFSNLQFLTAKLGDQLAGEEEDFALQSAAAETFLLFDMNGATYLIRQASLASIANAQHGTILPFFKEEAPNEEAEADGKTTTGRGETTIGADGAGNLAAVYVAPVENTTNNALYLAKFDPESGLWGSGTILAMNHLGVYEENIAKHRSNEDAERTYLGQNPDSALGGMDQLVFSHPQVAFGQTTDTLLVLTQGKMSYLKEIAQDGETVIVPVADADVTRRDFPRSAQAPAGLGVYAIGYGVGQQAIGNASLALLNYDFSAGSELETTVRFSNIGDVGIRGSEQQPITVTLSAEDGGLAEDLTSWTITENIIPGQQVAVSGSCALSRALGDGARILLTVRESEDYAQAGGTPYCASTDLLTLEDRPELGFEDPAFTLTDVDADGNAVIRVDAVAGNRGSAQAKHAFVQFSYDTGCKEEDGTPIFAPLDIRNSDLEQTDLQLLSVLSNDYKNGVLALGTLESGYGKHITGTLKVSAEQFRSLATGCLTLHAELFCDADSVDKDASGLYIGTHKDYNQADNLAETQIEHQTTFVAPDKLTVPMGNTLRLPVSLASTTGTNTPSLLLTEFPAHGSEAHFGIRSLRDFTYDAGHGTATVVLSPSSEGSGYLRIQDANTNDFFDIAYMVTSAAEGINIFNDNSLFAFRNADGTPFDPGAASASQSWVFDPVVPVWGADSTTPYLSNLSKGRIGSSFTFTTQAESMDFIFDGEVRIESDLPDFHPVTVSAGGGDGTQPGEYASVQFTADGTNHPHTVTVTVTGGSGGSGSAYFDRVVEHFSKNQGVPVPAEDAASPHVYWSRSFPDTASLETGTALQLQAYIIDDSALSSVTINGQTPQTLTRVEDGYWIAALTVSENGDLILEAVDEAGNRTVHSLTVDWFNTQTTAGASAGVPSVEATLLKVSGETVTPLTPETPFGGGDEARIQAQAVSSVEDGTPVLSATCLSVGDDGLEESGCIALSPGLYQANANGWYLIRASESAPNERQWSQTVVRMTRLSNPAMEAFLRFDEDSGTLRWSATSLGGYPITSATLNGQPIDFQASRVSASGRCRPACSGLHTLRVTDAQGNTATVTCSVSDLPIIPAEGKTAADVVTGVGVVHTTPGSITVHPDALSGGLYDAASGDTTHGVYEWLLQPAGGEPIEALVHTDGWTSEPTFAGLEPGAYIIYIRDAQDPLNAAVAASFPVTIGTEPFTHDWDGGTVTTPATCSEEGVRLFTCVTCGATRTEAEPKDPANHLHVTEDPGQPATCAAAGWSAFKKCDDCGVYLVAREELPRSEHTWDGGAVTREATCAEEGVKTFTCAACGATRTEAVAINPENHIHTTRYRGKRPTCTESGWTVYELCDDCGATIVAREPLPATGHNWDGGTITKPATCAAEGEKLFKCRACGETRTEPTEKDPANHVHVTETPGQPATCTVPGWTASRHCEDCGADLAAREELPAGHKWNSGAVTTPATCSAEGVKTFTCTVCGEKRTEPIEKDPANHVHVTEDPGKPATCTEPGWSAFKVCGDCGTYLDAREELPALDHSWNAGSVTTPATCSAEGVKTFTCTTCGETRTEPVAKDPANHVHVTEDPGKPATCTEPGWSAFKVCGDCGTYVVAREELPALDHSWDAGSITTPATCSAEGVKTFTCTACGATRTEPLEKDPANHVHVNVEPGKPATCTQAGTSDAAVCADCGTVLATHTPLAPIGHELPDGRIYGNCVHCGEFRCCICSLYESKQDVPVLGFLIRIAHAVLHPVTHLWFRLWNR